MRRLMSGLIVAAALTAPAMAQECKDEGSELSWLVGKPHLPGLCEYLRDQLSPQGLQRRQLDGMLEQAGLKDRSQPEDLLRTLPGMGGKPATAAPPATRPPVDFAAPTR